MRVPLVRRKWKPLLIRKRLSVWNRAEPKYGVPIACIEGHTQEPAVSASGSPQASLYSHGYFNQQGRKRAVNAKGRYVCDVCGKDYASTQSLRNHQRQKHEVPKWYYLGTEGVDIEAQYFQLWRLLRRVEDPISLMEAQCQGHIL